MDREHKPAKVAIVEIEKRHYKDAEILCREAKREKEKVMEKCETPISINIIFYIIFALSFLFSTLITLLVGVTCYRMGVMAEKISVLETQNPLPQEVK